MRDVVARAAGAAEAGRPAAAEAARAAGDSLRAAPPAAAVRWARSERLQTLLIGTALLLIALIVLASSRGIDLRLGITVPLLIVLVGAGVGLSQLDATERERWLSPVGASGRIGMMRLFGGIALVVMGVLLLVVTTFDVRSVTVALVAALVVLAGAALVLAPWGVRLWRDLEAERSLRVRETERGRDRRAPARLGPADAGADPAAAGRRRRGDPARQGPGARPPRLDLRGRARRGGVLHDRP